MLLTTLAVAAMLAQPAAPAPNIVVTAPAHRDAAAVRSYVRDASLVLDGQIARFRDPVCPTVFGLPPEYAARVVRRIRAVARAAGMPEAPETCTTNITILFANDSLSAVRELQRQRPILFSSVDGAEMRRLTDPARMPVRAWSTSETRSEDGGEVQVRSSDQRRDAGQPGDNVLRVRSASIISVPTQQLLTQSILVMEEQATVGKTLDQLADYAAVRGIAGSHAGSAALGGNSILSLFTAGTGAPRSLTAIDLAYLRALRQVRGNQRAGSQSAQIAQMIDTELAQGR